MYMYTKFGSALASGARSFQQHKHARPQALTIFSIQIQQSIPAPNIAAFARALSYANHMCIQPRRTSGLSFMSHESLHDYEHRPTDQHRSSFTDLSHVCVFITCL